MGIRPYTFSLASPSTKDLRASLRALSSLGSGTPAGAEEVALPPLPNLHWYRHCLWHHHHHQTHRQNHQQHYHHHHHFISYIAVQSHQHQYYRQQNVNHQHRQYHQKFFHRYLLYRKVTENSQPIDSPPDSPLSCLSLDCLPCICKVLQQGQEPHLPFQVYRHGQRKPFLLQRT